MHEQSPVARQECPVFTFHYAKQLPILRLGIISDIEAEQAQVAREFPKVAIHDKTRNTMDLQLMFLELRGKRSHRVHINHRVRFDYVSEIDRVPVNKDQADFRMRNAARLDYIFHRRFLVQGAFDDFTTGSRSTKKNKILVKCQANREHAHS